ncbi:MAG: DUF523 domain-containing protein [Erysipelotrichaceae bacterium]|jgi:uncharacterized protein YbbK (DUF523 family)|nr:DUF523 domain-containing protein [Erysipelotrichaceae bacterium]
METILISACLVGDKTRYDGRGAYHPITAKLLTKYDLVPFCPEVEGGLRIPRPKAERVDNKVITIAGKDVTHHFEKGADKVINIIKYLGIKKAILKENSPSCGVHQIYDGSFSETLVSKPGILTEVLIKSGVTVYTPDEFLKLLDE